MEVYMETQLVVLLIGAVVGIVMLFAQVKAVLDCFYIGRLTGKTRGDQLHTGSDAAGDAQAAVVTDRPEDHKHPLAPVVTDSDAQPATRAVPALVA